MDNQPSIVTPTPQASEPNQLPPKSVSAPPKAKHAHAFIFGYLALIILVAAVAGVYTWQHKKVTTLSKQVTTLDAQVVSLQKEVTVLKTQATTNSAQAQVNTSNIDRQQDVSAIAASFNDYISNNNGAYPPSCTGSTPCKFLSGLKLTYYTSGWNSANFIYVNSAQTIPSKTNVASANSVGLNDIYIATYMTCDANGDAAIVSSTYRQTALIFNTKTLNGSPQKKCIPI
ncbi:MAG TPA: hypothetical protein VMR28_03550 [Candidatus Saccharimonadales bacterium]|nr:hypothetical protein [Candidatus Saccharimonadales bacterium]